MLPWLAGQVARVAQFEMAEHSIQKTNVITLQNESARHAQM